MDAQRLFVSLLVCGVLVAALLVSDTGITGFVSTETVSKDVNLDVSFSQRFALSSDSPITSLSLSGEVRGSGLVNVYLSDGAEELLVFSNVRKISSSMRHVTGLAAINVEPQGRIDRIDSVEDGYTTVEGAFESQCAQTCVVSGLSGPLYLDVVVDPGTSFRISKIIFSQ